MRNLISILFIVCCSSAWADEFTVFEKDGFFGIKDKAGEITVPAVYKELGWSDGSARVIKGVIGFRKNNLWGLITVRNKSLTDQKFYSIQPSTFGYFKAAIKGRFSNHLFHGILDEKGKTIISFNYFSIESLGANWLVSEFDGKKQLYGVVSFENEMVVPTDYKSVSEKNNIFLAKQHVGKIDLYNKSGNTLQLGLDSLVFNKGWIAYRDGYAGYLSALGEVQYLFEYKSIEVGENGVIPHEFPQWTVYQDDTLSMQWKCDSLTVGNDNMLVAYLNGAHHLLLNNATLLDNHELVLKEFAGDHMIVQNSKTRKWSIIDADGETLTTSYDTIHAHLQFYIVQNTKGWWLLNRKGEELNRLPFESLSSGQSDQFIVRKGSHWGIFRPKEGAVTFKYDSLATLTSGYLVNYLNRWGIMNEDESWLIRPEYHELMEMGDFLIGRKGKSFTYFKNGIATYVAAFSPAKKLGSSLLIHEENQYGVLDEYGEVLINPSYDTISMSSDYFVADQQGSVSLISKSGQTVLSQEENYQQIADYGEGYFLVQKEGKWGFVDEQGRLRISNRYDNAGPFHDGMAPIMLREKWGFIDKNETLRVQPYYDAVEPFVDGTSIVQLEGKFGLLDKDGKEILNLTWNSIKRLRTGNFIIENEQGQYGLVNGEGSFILRPAYSHLQDFGDRVKVSKNGAWGVLSYTGQQLFKISYEDLKIVNNFTMIKN